MTFPAIAAESIKPRGWLSPQTRVSDYTRKEQKNVNIPSCSRLRVNSALVSAQNAFVLFDLEGVGEPFFLPFHGCFFKAKWVQPSGH